MGTKGSPKKTKSVDIVVVDDIKKIIVRNCRRLVAALSRNLDEDSCRNNGTPGTILLRKKKKN